MPFLKPDDTVHKVVSLPRWQRDWFNAHPSINYSGVMQDVGSKVIEQRDPSYFKEHKILEETRQSKRRENTQVLLQSIITQ